MRYLVILMMFIFAVPSWATMTVGSCPQEFEGRVKAIAEQLGPSTAFATQKVIFTNHQTLKGEVPDQVLIDMLSNGPFQVEAGKDYRVRLRDGKLCWIEQI
ncbi:MAG TPA: hypothetical protein VNJ08_02465 [Bacteriovoracaceae bacterium]|nr:hypothetical protein [Bacteriovoracaceae bacterium]